MSSSVVESLDFASLEEGYRSGRFTPVTVAEAVIERIDARKDDRVWIHRVPAEDILERARHLEVLDVDERRSLPLFGLPFAIKDNIDAAGHPTTAACPAYAYEAEEDAFVVARLLKAGAILIGKTNLDQFATGLVGTRSPYGACPNALNPDYISGGSSSGSAVAVASGLVSFALGTDTAGSGRVPAAFNNIVGLKPTRGLLSAGGVVPACRTLDCVSILALTANDAQVVLGVAQAFDIDDPFSRSLTKPSQAMATRTRLDGIRIAVPQDKDLTFFGDGVSAVAFNNAVRAVEHIGADVTPIDFSPFAEAARLLYEGPWVAERTLVARDLLQRDPDALHPATRAVVETGSHHSAIDTFQAIYRIAALRRQAEEALQGHDALLLPTAPTIYKISEVERDPIQLNTNLGTYTNFLNLFDMCGVAVPTAMRTDGLPFGVTFVGPAFTDIALLEMAAALHRSADVTLGATGKRLSDASKPVLRSVAPMNSPDRMQVAVCGAHMRGLALSHQLEALGGLFEREAQTDVNYALYAFENMDPPRPGLVRDGTPRSNGIALELWSLPTQNIGALLQLIAPPLGLGTIELSDGSKAQGFLCEAYAIDHATDITEFGGWRSFLAAGVGEPPDINAMR